MNELLSTLDRKARYGILPFLERLRDRLQLPIIYTHNMDEVERLADTLVLMRNDRTTGAGTLKTLQTATSLPLKQKYGAAVNLEVQFSRQENGLLYLLAGKENFYLPCGGVQPAHHMRIRIAAGDVSLALEKPEKSSILNILPGRILFAAAVGRHEMLVLVALGKNGEEAHILSRIRDYSWTKLGLTEGMPVYSQVKGVALLSRR